MVRKDSLKFGLSMFALLVLVACGGGGGYGGGGGMGGGGNGIITNIVISPGTSNLMPGMTQQFMAVSKDSSGNTISGASLTWTSSNTSVATVNSNGLATAKIDGSATITASISYNSSGGVYGGGGNPITYTSNMATISVTGSDMVMGTAAVGKALVSAVITLTDARGQSQTAMSDSEGRFQLSSAGMHAPFLLRADDSQGHTLFSMQADAGVANITPVTDLMTRAWFAAQGSSAEAAFADPAGHPAPDAAGLAQLNGRFTQALQGDLKGQGFDPQQFSFISTPFNADGTGADHILDNVGVVTGRGTMALEDRMGGQHIEVRLDSQMPALRISALVREGTDSSQSSI
ncbi:MAG TPA: Ig-like domain-containing protein [Gammaproteobacteria bacterium]|nr:Ig-like domain-containing protein [Gammaproteobacteria bacterium]